MLPTTVLEVGAHRDTQEDTLEDTPGLALALRAADEASWDTITSGIVDRHGRIDVVVNNPGVVLDATSKTPPSTAGAM